ncbi:unnamed protein product [Dicrocoelium dendriticum]|nr:unnamed protein product [Dicrocoelium dendriticum]
MTDSAFCEKLRSVLLVPSAPGLGVALFLNNKTPTVLLGSLTHFRSNSREVYDDVFKLLRESHPAHREAVLRDRMLHLVMPSIACALQLSTKLADADAPPYTRRRFKPLFFTESGVYLASMPPAENPDASSPGDGLYARLVHLGLLIVHSASNFPPTAVVNAVEKLVESGVL